MPNYANSQAYNFLNPTFVLSELEKELWQEKNLHVFRFCNCFNMCPSQVTIILHIFHNRKDICSLLSHLFFFLFTFCFCYYVHFPPCFFSMVSYYLAQIWLVFVFEKKAYNKTCFNSFNLYWTERKEGEREVVDVLTFI